MSRSSRKFLKWCRPPKSRWLSNHLGQLRYFSPLIWATVTCRGLSWLVSEIWPWNTHTYTGRQLIPTRWISLQWATVIKSSSLLYHGKGSSGKGKMLLAWGQMQTPAFFLNKMVLSPLCSYSLSKQFFFQIIVKTEVGDPSDSVYVPFKSKKDACEPLRR